MPIGKISDLALWSCFFLRKLHSKVCIYAYHSLPSWYSLAQDSVLLSVYSDFLVFLFYQPVASKASKMSFYKPILHGGKVILHIHAHWGEGGTNQFLKCYEFIFFSHSGDRNDDSCSLTHWNNCFTGVGIINWMLLSSSVSCSFLLFTPENPGTPSSSSFICVTTQQPF